ncbi:hydrolase [Pseudoneobacillus sp. C159]
MEYRNFKLDTEWNMVHYSEIPNGFGILIIGDERHFVDEHKSFWTQNEGKQLLLNQLKQNGYTIFYSNLYGRHWGNKKSTMLAERLYHHIMRSEILNTKIHIIAEGMGALIALDLMKSLNDQIRSIVFINPIFSLKIQLELEKEQKFFYKKILREIALAYNNDLENIENQNELPEPNLKIPIKIIHVLSDRRSYRQMEYSKQVFQQWEQQNVQIQFSFLVPEKKQRLGKIIHSFFKENEKEL